jgi:hypothetical protein
MVDISVQQGRFTRCKATEIVQYTYIGENKVTEIV